MVGQWRGHTVKGKFKNIFSFIIILTNGWLTVGHRKRSTTAEAASSKIKYVQSIHKVFNHMTFIKSNFQLGGGGGVIIFHMDRMHNIPLVSGVRLVISLHFLFFQWWTVSLCSNLIKVHHKKQREWGLMFLLMSTGHHQTHQYSQAQLSLFPILHLWWSTVCAYPVG